VKVAVVAIKGDKTLTELAEKFDFHANQSAQWRTQLLEGAIHPDGLSAEQKFLEIAKARTRLLFAGSDERDPQEASMALATVPYSVCLRSV
jgi:transposase-like protein